MRVHLFLPLVIIFAFYLQIQPTSAISDGDSSSSLPYHVSMQSKDREFVSARDHCLNTSNS